MPWTAVGPGCLWVAPGCRCRRRGEFVGRRLQPGPGSDVCRGGGLRFDQMSDPERPKEPMSAHPAPRPHRTRRLRTALGVSAVGAALAVTGTLTAQADPAGTRTPAGSHPTARTEPAPAPADAHATPARTAHPSPVPSPARTAPPAPAPATATPSPVPAAPSPVPATAAPAPEHPAPAPEHPTATPEPARPAPVPHPRHPRHQRPGTPAPVPQQH